MENDNNSEKEFNVVLKTLRLKQSSINDLNENINIDEEEKILDETERSNYLNVEIAVYNRKLFEEI